MMVGAKIALTLDVGGVTGVYLVWYNRVGMHGHKSLEIDRS